MIINAYAKINLTLDVFSLGADGYHSLASVMQTISLSDTLEFHLLDRQGIEFTCSCPGMPDVPLDSSNLVVRAAEATIVRASQLGRTPKTGVCIHLIKNIPSQAGLGGGSSDAAAALSGVNRMLKLGLSAEEQIEIAFTLGSDIPFFLTGGCCCARGRGEELTPLSDIPSLWIVIVKPDVCISTPWAYSALDELPERASHRATMRMEKAVQNCDVNRIIAYLSNDFELPIFMKYSDLAWLRDEMQMAGALNARLCGSGSAIFGILESQGAAEQCARRLQSRYAHVSVSRTLSRYESNPDEVCE